MKMSPTFAAAPFVELRQSFPSRGEAISPFVDQLMHFIARFRDVHSSEAGIELALREALANAVIHGNHEDPHKRVFISCRCTTNGEVSIKIQDEGQGFESGAVPDPTTVENRLRTSGRGIYLMRTFMDDVHFEERATVVCMHKKPTPHWL
jgi:serine/threonine-protein kinase RsbW